MVAVALGRSGHDAADPVGVTASPGCVRRHDCMKTESLRANISRWGYGRTLLAGFMSCLRTYAGVHIYRVNLRPLAPRSVAPPQLPAGISLCIVPPPKLLDAAKDPELDMESGFVRAALGRGDVAFGAFDGDQLIAYVWRPFGAAPSSFRVLARNRLIRLWHSHSHCLATHGYSRDRSGRESTSLRVPLSANQRNPVFARSTPARREVLRYSTDHH